MALLAPLAMLCAASCRSLEITPAALREKGGRAPERAVALARWEESIGLMNEFLASSCRRTLPEGRFALAGEGMTFTSASGQTWPIQVCATTWGDLVVAIGFRAQEGQCGFCVGATQLQPGEARDGLLDNTFFRHPQGFWEDAASLAEVTLHETTHVVLREGTIGPWNTLGYYLVLLTCWSGVEHPAERLPYATSAEFERFLAERAHGPAGAGLLSWRAR
ncbi:MAG: hypothetical protein IPJ19_17255 [Planctomycetes bacterium]|nr:hypothetical protein [Planctomycetota bacterium]